MKNLPQILITGANGQLGRALRELSVHFPQFEYVFLSRTDFPIHHAEMIDHFFEIYQPEYLINCAAYTAVDKAETEKEKAFLVNARAVGWLALRCKKYRTRFIHISTDYVFNGNTTVPYTEEDLPDPINVYGASKYEGEKRALQHHPDSMIIRTSWLYSCYGKNFVKTMLSLMKEKEEVRVVNDQFGSPTYAADLAEAIMTIISSAKWASGIYHYCNSGVISWYDFALAIKELSGLSCRIIPIPTSAYPTPARRPAFSALNMEKIISSFHLKCNDWKTSLEKMLLKNKFYDI
ncbi:MAG: dTDP-4-dehydrorhamnose reductase [Chitinophagaceae bacterium]|nr:dTDP-4-dehydrorhamnose reductase [Chitinophagaceae bacterium]